MAKKEKIKKPKIPRTRSQKIRFAIHNFAAAIFLLAFISTSYFLVLISTEAKSFPFITKKIEEYVNKKLDGQGKISIQNSYLEFDDFHKLSITLDQITLNMKTKEEVKLPKIEAQFSIFDLIIFRFIPKKVSLIGSVVEIDRTVPNAKILFKKDQDESDLGYDILNQDDYFKDLWPIFLSFRDVVSEFEIRSSLIILKNKFGSNKIDIKTINIKSLARNDHVNLLLTSDIGFNRNSTDLKINGSCKFKKDDGIKCDLSILDFTPKTIAKLDEKLAQLSKIEGKINAKLNLKINSDYSLSDASFTISSAKGSFNYPQFFSKTIDFSNLTVNGELDNLAKVFKITDLQVFLENSPFSMKLNISNYFDPNSEKTQMEFKIGDAFIDDLEKYWPVFLNQNGIRKWVIDHIKNGVIKDAYATIEMKKENGLSKIDLVKSEVVFSGLDLSYDEYFPSIKEIDGIASFSEDKMNIDLISGKVLDSQVRSVQVEIPSFSAKKTMLNVSGNISGLAFDSLKHINYKGDFAAKIGNYFNGNADSSIDIRLPLQNKIELKDLYIKVSSEIKNFNTEFIDNNSSISLNTIKEAGKNDFITNIDLTGANINLSSFGILKPKDATSKISTTLSIAKDNNHLALKNLVWTKKDSKLQGGIVMQISPFKILAVDLNNHNFGNNEFNLSYKVDANNLYQNLKVTGKALDLAPLLNIKSSGDNNVIYKQNNFWINLSNVKLANKQNINRLNVSINCNQGLCKNGFIKALMSGNKNIDINIYPVAEQNYTTIDGRIEDISVLAKGLDISDKIISGDIKIDGKIEEREANQVISGSLKINKSFYVIRNNVVEKISNENEFVKIKDELFDQDKIKLDTLKLEFELEKHNFKINKLITGNYLIGFTAKGNIDLSTSEANLRGLIVPGYSLNKLFGIGNLPVIGHIISPVIIGEEGGGIFAIKYEYHKAKDQKEGEIKINPATAIVPGGMRNIFDLF